ncbi:uncharacterized protein ColSpa_09366 [Colletotrichum spaethianum]|uniref:Uncharacterized protein n=1 Tax=Colletotrichum spaethianum TaxID=700344 RepID=A0AA37UNS1_9PEZI|nr:uncharacterized protein ColSpa_09366 [Colletotrichum spaethianum]GKT49185.1 hypothetical protein ColSpa_09366 [Colletotrichum spaethianum]
MAPGLELQVTSIEGGWPLDRLPDGRRRVEVCMEGPAKAPPVLLHRAEAARRCNCPAMIHTLTLLGLAPRRN